SNAHEANTTTHLYLGALHDGHRHVSISQVLCVRVSEVRASAAAARAKTRSSEHNVRSHLPARVADTSRRAAASARPQRVKINTAEAAPASGAFVVVRVCQPRI